MRWNPAVSYYPLDKTSCPVAAKLRFRTVGFEETGCNIRDLFDLGFAGKDNTVGSDPKAAAAERSGKMSDTLGRGEYLLETATAIVDAYEIVAASGKLGKIN